MRTDDADRGDVTQSWISHLEPAAATAARGVGTLFRAIQLGSACAAGAILAGCGMSSSMTSGIGNGILGGSASVTAAPKGVNEEQLLHAAKSDGEVITGASRQHAWLSADADLGARKASDRLRRWAHG